MASFNSYVNIDQAGYFSHVVPMSVTIPVRISVMFEPWQWHLLDSVDRMKKMFWCHGFFSLFLGWFQWWFQWWDVRFQWWFRMISDGSNDDSNDDPLSLFFCFLWDLGWFRWFRLVTGRLKSDLRRMFLLHYKKSMQGSWQRMPRLRCFPDCAVCGWFYLWEP